MCNEYDINEVIEKLLSETTLMEGHVLWAINPNPRHADLSDVQVGDKVLLVTATDKEGSGTGRESKVITTTDDKLWITHKNGAPYGPWLKANGRYGGDGFPGLYRRIINMSMTQSEHEKHNAGHYPGTRQICAFCDDPTGRCEDDDIDDSQPAGDGGPAYPQPLTELDNGHMAWEQGMGGMSFEDAVAIRVLPELIRDDISLSEHEHARAAYEYAEAMVRERKERGS